MCYVKNAKKIVRTVIARPPGRGDGRERGTTCARFNCTRLCRRSAVARNSPPCAFARRVYQIPGYHRRPDDYLRKEIVSVGSGRVGPGRVGS